MNFVRIDGFIHVFAEPDDVGLVVGFQIVAEAGNLQLAQDFRIFRVREADHK